MKQNDFQQMILGFALQTAWEAGRLRGRNEVEIEEGYGDVVTVPDYETWYNTEMKIDAENVEQQVKEGAI